MDKDATKGQFFNAHLGGRKHEKHQLVRLRLAASPLGDMISVFAPGWSGGTERNGSAKMIFALSFAFSNEPQKMERREMKLRTGVVALAFGIACMFATRALAQEKKPDKPADKPPAAKPADEPADKPADKPAAKPADKPAAGKPADAKPGIPSAEDMKKYMEMTGPGKEHEALKPLEGMFSCDVKMAMDPSQPMQESKATVNRKWILGGRYLQEEVKGDMAGMGPFEGFGVTGYDKLQKMYHSYWVDSAGTGTWITTGTADASGKKFTFGGENFDPMAMKKKDTKTVLEITDNSKHSLKMYDKGPDGKEFLAFDMTCTKK